METPYRLHYAPDNASLIIRLVLDEMGLPFETVLVDRATSQQKGAAYRALNPVGKIPTLETPQGVISETGAILLYLSEAHGQMAPQAGHPQRPAFLKWLFFTSNTLHPDLIMQFYLHRYGPQEALPAVRTRVVERLKGHFALLNQVAETGPGWLGAPDPSVLDVYIAACLRWAALYPQGETGWFDIQTYPALHDMALRLEARASAQNAITAEGLGPTPFTQPSTPNPPEGVAL